MTRWAKSQPSLRMMDGGSAMLTEMQHYSPMMSMPASLAMADGGMAGPKPNPLTPDKPQTPIPNWMRYSLREGREVPGEGQGDKIPAMLEPDEFVVSNSMMERKPGLRETLHSIRDETLEAEGKDPREVDAKQVRQATLRAEDGRSPGRALVPVPGTGDNGFRPNFTMPGPEAPQPSRALVPVPGTGDNGYRPNFTTPGESVTSPRSMPYRAGQATMGAARTVGKVLADPRFIGAQKLAGAVDGISHGTQAVTDFQDGNVAGGIDNSLRSAASVAGTMAGRAGVPGLAFTAGHAIGEHVINPNLSDETKNSIGETVNGYVRGAGKMLGQDWGADDSALQKINKVGVNGLTPTSAARPSIRNGADAPAPGSNQGAYDTANADFSRYAQRQGAAPNTEEGVVKRVGNSFSGTNVTGYGNQNVAPAMDPGLIAETLRNPDGSKWGAADNARMAQNIRDGVDPKAGTSGQVRDPIAEFQANAPKRGEFGYRQAQNDLARMRAERVQTRGQDITSADSRYGHELTASNNRARLRYDMGKDQRDYDTGRADHAQLRGDKGFEQNQAADKAWTDHTTSVFRKTDDKGNDVPDTQKAAAFTQAVDETLSQFIAELNKNPDPKIRAKADDLAKRGRAGLDAEDRGTMQMLFERQQTHGATADNIGPLNSSGPKSKNLMDYRIKGKDGDAWFQSRQKTVGGQSIPDVDLRYGPNANRILPNLGAGSNYATPNRLRGE